MPRYFIEIAYKGTVFNGIQIQLAGLTVQGEINRALSTIFKQEILTTTASRTDAGVHAQQNFLHFDIEQAIPNSLLYSMNAILHGDIVVKNIIAVGEEAHARFDAIGRKYLYYVTAQKNPFCKETAYYFPFLLDIEKMNQAATTLLQHHDFTSFSKRNTEVKTNNCSIAYAFWTQEENGMLCFTIEANRFLRGMVRGIVGTLLQVGRGKLTIPEFEEIILSKDCTLADFSAEAQGLFLHRVIYPDGVLLHALPHR